MFFHCSSLCLEKPKKSAILRTLPSWSFFMSLKCSMQTLPLCLSGHQPFRKEAKKALIMPPGMAGASGGPPVKVITMLSKKEGKSGCFVMPSRAPSGIPHSLGQVFSLSKNH